MKGRTAARILVIAAFAILLVGAVVLRMPGRTRTGYMIIGAAFITYFIGRVIYLFIFLKQRKAGFRSADPAEDAGDASIRFEGQDREGG